MSTACKLTPKSVITAVKGFTLIELMVVVGITAVIGAIAIPNVLEMRMFGREAAAASALTSQIMPAMHQFQGAYQQDEALTTWGVFPSHLSALAGGNKASAHASLVGRMGGPCNYIPENFNNFDGKKGTNVGHYQYTPGANTGYFEDRGAVVDGYCYTVLNDPATTDDGLRHRQMFVTVIATPTGSMEGRRSFGFTINPSYYDHIVSMTNNNNNIHDLMLDAIDYPDQGMFQNPTGSKETFWRHGKNAMFYAK